MNNMSPIDPDVLLIWEKQLKEREKELKKKETQMGVFLHDLNHYIHVLSNSLHYYDNDSDFERKEIIREEIIDYSHKIRHVISAYQLFFHPKMLEHDIVCSRDVRAIISHICSLYSRNASMKNISIHLIEELKKEYIHKLGNYLDLAVAMVIDGAIKNAPNNTDFNISFFEGNECLTVEFKCWEICIDGEDDYYSMKHEFGAGIIWNGTDKYIALTLFKQICDSYNINYAFSKGDEKKVIDDNNCQSSIVKLTFNK